MISELTHAFFIEALLGSGSSKDRLRANSKSRVSFVCCVKTQVDEKRQEPSEND